MKNQSPLIKGAFQTCAITALLATALGGCGGGDTSAVGGSAVVHAVATTQIVPPSATFEGRTYAQWEASFWRWALGLPTSPLPHPFNDCNNRPISADQSGGVWYWSAPIAKVTCNQSATIIPPGTALFLTTLDVESSSLDAPPFYAPTVDGQQAIAQTWAAYIQDLFVEIDGKSVDNVKAYLVISAPFSFTAPSPWIFGDTGGNGTGVGDGYFFMLQLPPGSHTIHYGGTLNPPKGKSAKMDVTLLITVGG